LKIGKKLSDSLQDPGLKNLDLFFDASGILFTVRLLG